jgi:hypothetical protein
MGGINRFTHTAETARVPAEKHARLLLEIRQAVDMVRGYVRDIDAFERLITAPDLNEADRANAAKFRDVAKRLMALAERRRDLLMQMMHLEDEIDAVAVRMDELDRKGIR